MIFVAVCCRGSRELRSSAWRYIRIRGWSISMEHEILGYFSDNGSVGWGARGAPRGLVSRTGVGHWDSSDVARRREVERYRDGHSTLGDHTTRTRRRGPSALTLRRHERGPVRAGRSVRRVTLKSESEVFRERLCGTRPIPSRARGGGQRRKHQVGRSWYRVACPPDP